MENKTSWGEIRKVVTKDTIPGSMGELKKIAEGVEIYVTLRPFLNDIDESIIAFNNDEVVRTALLNRQLIKDIRKATGWI
jgi:hypothetical protein